jgi:hypothetical protein
LAMRGVAWGANAPLIVVGASVSWVFHVFPSGDQDPNVRCCCFVRSVGMATCLYAFMSKKGETKINYDNNNNNNNNNN